MVRGVLPPPFVDKSPPFFKISLFVEIQDFPALYRLIGKTKLLNDSFTHFIHFYPQSILILEEYL